MRRAMSPPRSDHETQALCTAAFNLGICHGQGHVFRVQAARLVHSFSHWTHQPSRPRLLEKARRMAPFKAAKRDLKRRQHLMKRGFLQTQPIVMDSSGGVHFGSKPSRICSLLPFRTSEN